MPPYSKHPSALSGELVWKMWFQEETNTLQKISDRLTEEGKLNAKGEPYSRFGISIAAWKYACQNIPEAKNDFKSSYEGRKLPFDRQAEENFYRKLMAASKNVYYGRVLEKWIAENDLEQFRKYL